ncbi:hypothetical protein HDU88_002466 [Geranomyces variabilis]|nr:hypothetical protein HDU88_002466 [Geranomyces variabilis]
MPGHDVDIPPSEAITLAELEGRVVHITSSEDPALFQYVRADGVLYPALKLPYAFSDPTDVVFPVAHLRELAPEEKTDVGKVEAVLDSLWSSWTSNDWVPNVYSTKLAGALKLVLSKLQDLTFSSSASSKQLKASNNSPLRALAWHHSRQVIAMAHRQDSVHIYDLVSEKWLPPPPSGLKHDFQKDVTAIEWNPQLGTLLAVTSRFGVCLWRLVFDPPPSNYHAPNGVPDFIDDSSACHGWMSLLRFPGCEQINVIAWSPDGKLLAAGSRESSTILVWDVATETATPFGTRGRGTRSLGLCVREPADERMRAARVKWLSDTTHLADFRDVIRIYETRTWAFQTLNTQKLRPHSVCWMPDSKMFMFAVETGRSIVVQQLNRPAPALEIKQVTRFRMPDFHSETHDLSIGGKVKSLAIDPTGKRLAVCFDGEHRGAELIALFAMTNRPMPDIELTGYIRGPQWNPQAPKPQPPRSPYQNGTSRRDKSAKPATEGEERDGNSGEEEEDDAAEAEAADVAAAPLPTAMRFAPEFSRGALLSIAWENGQVQFVPLYTR